MRTSRTALLSDKGNGINVFKAMRKCRGRLKGIYFYQGNFLKNVNIHSVV